MSHYSFEEDMRNQSEVKKLFRVEYDGPSRPIIVGPKMNMFSISKFIDGRWTSFNKEVELCQILCDALNEKFKTYDAINLGE